jgi:hypothetical protein
MTMMTTHFAQAHARLNITTQRSWMRRSKTMKVEIEITKKDLRSILCAAIRNYYGKVNLCVEPNTYTLLRDRRDEVIIDNLYDIRDACDAISNLCDMIEEVDTVDNDARGVICFNQDEEEEK